MTLFTAAHPGLVLWSKLPIVFQIGFTGMDPTYRLQIQFINNADSSVLADLAFPFNTLINSETVPATVDGTIKVSAHKVLDPCLNYQLPSFAGITGNSQLMTNDLKFHIQYRATGATLATQEFTVDATAYTLKKGGVGDMTVINEFINNNAVYSRANFLPNSSQFLTWMPSGRAMMPDERGWLVYFSDAADNTQKIVYNVKYRDGSTATFNRNLDTTGITNFQYHSWFVPTGIKQCGLDLTNKGVVSYILTVTGTGGTSETYTIYADYRPWYKSMTVYYRNAMGGLDQFHFKGTIERGYDAQKYQAEQSRIYPANSDGPEAAFYSSMRLTWKCNTGYIKQEEQGALLDLMNTTYAALLINGNTFVPLRVPAQKGLWMKTDSGIFNAVIQIETAATFEVIPRQLQNI